MATTDRWNWMREQTPAATAHHYLNAGWSGAISLAVAEAQRAWIDLELHEGPTTKAVFEQRVDMRDRYRAAMAGVFGASPEEVTITENTTEGVNIVTNGLRYEAGQNVVTTSIEHPSGIVPAYYLRERHGLDLRIVPLDASLDWDEMAHRFEDAIDRDTRLVLISEISYATGQLLPLARIVEIAHRHGARVLVDGAQNGGHMPLRVRESNVDYYAITSHKWLLGPDGIGALYVREDLVEELEPAKVGGRAAASWDNDGNFEPKRDAITKFELTTVSPVATAGALAAIEQYQASGPDAVWDRVRALNRAAEARFHDIPGVTIISPTNEEARTGLFAFRVNDTPARGLSAFLQQYGNVVCRSVAEQDAVRLSLHVYNNEEDIEAAAEAVEQAARDGLPEEILADIAEA